MPNRFQLSTVLALVGMVTMASFTPATGAPSEAAVRGIAKCNAVLAGIRKVSAAQVKAFEGNSWLLPLCQTTAEMRAMDLDTSKAAGLVDAIVGNPSLLKTLQSRGYSADQIVGFSISVDGARIFVHGD